MEFEDANPLFRKAIELGINFFDTANVYQLGSSEIITGKLIREFGLNRDEIVVATKVNFDMRNGKPNGGGSSRKNIMAEIDHSLERLGLDYVAVRTYPEYRRTQSLDEGAPTVGGLRPHAQRSMQFRRLSGL